MRPNILSETHNKVGVMQTNDGKIVNLQEINSVRIASSSYTFYKDYAASFQIYIRKYR